MTPKFVFSLSWCRVVDGVKGAARRVGMCFTVLGLVGGAPAQGWGGDTAPIRVASSREVCSTLLPRVIGRKQPSFSY